MRSLKAYFVIFAFISWSILSILVTIIDSFIVARGWQITTFTIFGFAVFAFFSQPIIISNKIIRILLTWGMYVSFVNLIYSGKYEYGYINALTDVLWFPSVFVLFYSIFITNKFDALYSKFVKGFPLFYFILFFLVLYKMVFQFGSMDSGFVTSDQINSVFWVLLLVPFAFLVESRFLKYLIFVSTYILVLASTKRSAAIALSLVMGISLINDFFIRKNALKSIPIGIILLLLLVFIFNTSISKLDINVLDRLQETSFYEEARIDLLRDSWANYQNKSLFSNFFGSGHRSTAFDRGRDMNSKTSHNDFFEVLYNYGFIGLFLYFSFVWQISKRLILLKGTGGKYFDSYLASYIIFIIMSMVSHLVIYPTYYAFLLVFWAMMEFKIDNLICVRTNIKSSRTI